MSARAAPRGALWLLGAALLVPHGGNPPPPPPPVDPGPAARRLHDLTSPPLPGPRGPGGAPSTPPPGGASAGGARGGGYGARRNGESGDFERWEYWWDANDDLLMAWRAERRSAARTDLAVPGFGRAAPSAGAAATQPLDAADRERVRAALLAALASDEAEIADSAALALARCTPVSDAGQVLGPLLAALRHRAASVREAATLGLGIVGHPGALPVLQELLGDTPRGRERVGGSGPVTPFVRAFAAAALGLIGDAAAFESLAAALQLEEGRGDRDVQALAIRALGLLDGAAERSVPLLRRLLTEESRLDRVARAQVPLALAQLAEGGTGAMARGTLPALVALVASDATELELRRSSAIALGRMAHLDEPEALAALRGAATARDAQLAHFAVMALAAVAQRGGDGSATTALAGELLDFLRAQRLTPRGAHGASYAALAQALWTRQPAPSAERVAETRVQLLEALRGERQPSRVAALALALGLADAQAARAELVARLPDEANPVVQSYLALALGLLRAEEAGEPLRVLLRDPRLGATGRLQVARALGLIGDRRALPALVAQLHAAETYAEAGAATQALGLIGDRGALDPLLELAADATLPAARRGFAVQALGLLAEKSALPWSTAFNQGCNYRALTPALVELYDLF
ncbi:MAG: HEAT repeat domain-containing protein [Planctomycetes bacterium]|nr:HEAT repeat domain-containing protein [Planctomycetota bacterium]